jgi:hypothetical protein
VVARIELTDEQIELVKEWCRTDTPIRHMMRDLGIRSYEPVRRVIREYCPGYVISGQYRGSREQVGKEKPKGHKRPPCQPGCGCRVHRPKTETTLVLLRQPKRRRVGENGCWATRVVDYRKNVFNAVCGICGKPEADLPKLHHVDHDHQTDLIRGILCNNCNLKLGWYEKYAPEIAAYLNGGGALCLVK